jgi:hypothetical protein
VKVLAIALFVVGVLLAAQQANATDWRSYAKAEAAKAPYRWTGQEWLALDAIVTPESGWNPCRRYPQTTDCAYAGSNSCGIPQASPCPQEWRGRLGTTARTQIRWLLGYVKRRYGDPLAALAFRRAYDWY